MGVQQKRKLVFAGIASLLFALSPVIAAAADDSSTTTVSATVNSVISIETDGTVAISLTPTVDPVVSSNNDEVTVSTNNMTGYNLTLQDTDTTTTLTGIGNAGNTFTSIGGGINAAAALTNGTWGFAIATGTTGLGTNNFDASYSTENNSTTSTSKWAGVPSSSGSAVTIKSTSTTAVGDITDVWFAARAAASQPADTYTNTVRYTATTNI